MQNKDHHFEQRLMNRVAPLRTAARRLATQAAVMGVLVAALLGGASAAVPLPLPTRLTLTHVAADRWRADYVFSEPVTGIDLGAQIGPYRKQAWHVLTPGVELLAQGDQEALRCSSPLTRLSVEISAYDDFDAAQYAPIDRFSDGGWDFYLGFLHGTPIQGGRERSMDVALALHGLPGEAVIAPAKSGVELQGYAHFGPRLPARMGQVNVIIDPQAPAWLREVIDETTTKVSQFYEQAFQRKLIDTPLISVAVVGFEGPPGGMNIKGGVAGGGIAYRLQGRGLVDDHPKRRAYIARLVAHEMAHLWQINLTRGGIGGDQAWIHEGGAEALMLEALRTIGLFTEQDSAQYAQALLKECDQLQGDVVGYRGRYACGFTRFHGYAMSPVPLWRAMLARSETSGEFYSEAMIREILKP